MKLHSLSGPRPLFLLLFVIILTTAELVPAQMAGRSNETTETNFGGHNFIVGSVYLASGQRVKTRLRVRLASVTAGTSDTNTDDSGSFGFSGLSNGTYSVSIVGDKEYESTTQQVEVKQLRGEFPTSYTLSFKLIPKQKTEVKPGVIKAENAGIPKHVLELFDKAMEFSRAGDHKSAVEQLKLAITANPTFFVALSELGSEYIKLNDLQKADETLQQALKLKPDAFDPLVNRGILLTRQNRFADAETSLRTALKVNEQSDVAHYYLGRVLAKLNRAEEAEKQYLAAIAVGGDGIKEAHRMLASLYLDKQDDKRAVAELEIYLKLAPTAPDSEQLRDTLKKLKDHVQKEQQ